MIPAGANSPDCERITVCPCEGPPIRFLGQLLGHHRARGRLGAVEVRLWRCDEGGFVVSVVDASEGRLERAASRAPDLESAAAWLEARLPVACPAGNPPRLAEPAARSLCRRAAQIERAELFAALLAEATYDWWSLSAIDMR